MTIDAIEELGKELHLFAEMFEVACKSGDGFEASIVVGRIASTIPRLKEMARVIHGMNEELNTVEDKNLLS